MKRSGLRSRPRPRPSIGRLPAQDFRKATVRGWCAADDCLNQPTDPHHVVYAQHLRRHGLPQWDVRDGLPLCRPCHEAHHNGSKRLPLTALTDSNLEFAFEQLGAYAWDYLNRRYTGADRRLDALLAAVEERAA